MKVDGDFFRESREKIKIKNVGEDRIRIKDSNGEISNTRIGTQSWLANIAGVSVKSVKNLERGEASLVTLERVSKELDIENYEAYIPDYYKDDVVILADSHIDFRPEVAPGQDLQFINSVMVMTLDPLTITVNSEEKEPFLLTKVKARLTGLGEEIIFTWLAEVSLTNGAQGWLGLVAHLNELRLETNNETRYIPVMFKQEYPSRILWHDFVEKIEKSEKGQFNVELEFEFAQFTKMIDIRVPIQTLQDMFKDSRIKYESDWPYRAQLRTIV